MPKISNMPDMGDGIDIPDSKPKKPDIGDGMTFDPSMSPDEIASQIVEGLMSGKISASDLLGQEGGNPEDPESAMESLGLDKDSVDAILKEFVKSNNGDISNVPLETIVQHFLIEMQKTGLACLAGLASGDPNFNDLLADIIDERLGELNIPYANERDSQFINNLTSLLANNGRAPNHKISITEAEFYADKLAMVVQSKIGGDTDEIFNEIYDAISDSDGNVVADIECGETGANIVSGLMSVYDALSTAMSSPIFSGNKKAAQPAVQTPTPAAAPAQAASASQAPQQQSAPSGTITDEDSVREVLRMANGGDSLSEEDIENILANYDAGELNQMAADYSSGEDWSDGGVAYAKLLAYMGQQSSMSSNPTANAAAGPTPAQPQPQAPSQQAQQQSQPKAQPKPAAPKLSNFSDFGRATHVAGFLCKTDQDLESELMTALGNPSKDDKDAYPSTGLETFDCANKDEIDFDSAILEYQRFYVSSNTDKFILCRTVSNDNDNVGFDFSVFKGTDNALHVYVPLMFNTIRQDGKPIKITDYVPREVLETPSDDEDDRAASMNGILASMFGGASPIAATSLGQNATPDETVAKNITKYHQSVLSEYDQRKTEAYCNLAIKEKTFVSMCVKDFGTLDKKIENKQYMHGFVYVGDITPKKDDIDVDYFISDHELDKKDKYEFYVKLSTSDLTPDDLALLKPMVANLDYGSDPINNIDLESDGEILYISIPVVYYLKK